MNSPLAQLAVIATSLIPLAPGAPARLAGIWLIAVATAWILGARRNRSKDHDIGWPA